MDEREAREKFSALVVPFSRGDLAQASERTKEAAKHWKSGSRAPNASSLITLARRIPAIREWLYSEIEAWDAGAEQQNSGAVLNAMMVGLQMAAQMPGEQGAQARTLLAQLQRGEG